MEWQGPFTPPAFIKAMLASNDESAQIQPQVNISNATSAPSFAGMGPNTEAEANNPRLSVDNYQDLAIDDDGYASEDEISRELHVGPGQELPPFPRESILQLNAVRSCNLNCDYIVATLFLLAGKTGCTGLKKSFNRCMSAKRSMSMFVVFCTKYLQALETICKMYPILSML
jgi:hypothetical protein